MQGVRGIVLEANHDYNRLGKEMQEKLLQSKSGGAEKAGIFQISTQDRRPEGAPCYRRWE